MCDTDLITFLRERVAGGARAAGPRKRCTCSCTAEQRGRQGQAGPIDELPKRARDKAIQRMRRGPRDQPDEVQRLLLGLGLQLRATHAADRAALIDAYDLAENERGTEVRARLFGRHGRGSGTGKRRKRANGLSYIEGLRALVAQTCELSLRKPVNWRRSGTSRRLERNRMSGRK
jgi:hypothetical protein